MKATARKQQQQQQRQRVPCSWIGLKKLPACDLKFNAGLTVEVADRVTIETTDLTPWASDVFTEEEMGRRIELMAARFEARMPTDGSTPDLDQEQEESSHHPPCWGCGEPAPMRQSNHMFGWHHRMAELIPGGKEVVELCCPDCWVAIGCRWYESAD
jgi:hypothetical protein